MTIWESVHIPLHRFKCSSVKSRITNHILSVHVSLNPDKTSITDDITHTCCQQRNTCGYLDTEITFKLNLQSYNLQKRIMNFINLLIIVLSVIYEGRCIFYGVKYLIAVTYWRFYPTCGYPYADFSTTYAQMSFAGPVYCKVWHGAPCILVLTVFIL